jgi:RimJ/RimL family protein N-acetyltransferase
VALQGEALRTERLILRPWRPEDAAPMAAINSDPAVTEFLNRRMDAAATAAFLDRTEEHWAEHGFGHWAVEPQGGPLAGEMIGFVRVAYPTFLPDLATRPELGWRLSAASWGKGYATEAALAPGGTTKMGMTIERQIPNPVLAREVDVWQVPAAISDSHDPRRG